MPKITSLLLFLLALGGCAATPPPAPYGSFLETPIAAGDKRIVSDVVKKLTALYPPARTRLNLQHATPDVFGTELVDALREQGYAIAEVKPGTPAAAPAVGDQSLAYILDQPLDAGMYRVTLLVNSQTLTRVYQSADGALAPAGAWVRKE